MHFFKTSIIFICGFIKFRIRDIVLCYLYLLFCLATCEEPCLSYFYSKPVQGLIVQSMIKYWFQFWTFAFSFSGTILKVPKMLPITLLKKLTYSGITDFVMTTETLWTRMQFQPIWGNIFLYSSLNFLIWCWPIMVCDSLLTDLIWSNLRSWLNRSKGYFILV